MNETQKLSTADILNRPPEDQGSVPHTDTRTTQTEQPLVAPEQAADLQERWSAIQTQFVDEPRTSVEDADALVAEVIQSLAKRFADERQKLEQQWQGGGDVNTEDLRQALQHYRTFFQRLLAA